VTKDPKFTAGTKPLTPAEQTGEEFGKGKPGQRDGDHPKVRSDTPRGSEVETRNSSNRRG
jgi:hypothetical protein